MKKALKVLPLLAVAIAAMLAFTGCDKILEVFYPEFGDQGGGGGGRYTLVFNVKLPTGTLTDYNQYKLAVTLEKPDGTVVTRSEFARSPATPGGDATYTARFENLGSGPYRAFAFQDKNGNGTPNEGEPFGVAKDENGFDLEFFYLEDTTESQTLTYDVKLFVPDMSGQNTVKAKVWIPKTISGWDSPNWIKVKLEKQMGDQIYQPMRTGTAGVSTDPNKGFAEIVYNNVPGGAYRAFAWLDINANNVPDPNEPYGVPGTGEFLDLPAVGGERVLDIQINPGIDPTTATNNLSVTVWVDMMVPNWATPNIVKVNLERTDGPPPVGSFKSLTAVMDGTRGKATVMYNQLPNGWYRVVAWVDNISTDNMWNMGEPGGAMFVMGYGESFPLPQGTVTTVTGEIQIWAPAPPPAADVPDVFLTGPTVISMNQVGWQYFNYRLVVLDEPDDPYSYVERYDWNFPWGYAPLFSTTTGDWFTTNFPANVVPYSGYYRFDTSNVKLNVGGRSGQDTNWPGLEVRFVNEPQTYSGAYPTWGGDYVLVVQGYGLDGFPSGLDYWTSYDVKIVVTDVNGYVPSWWTNSWTYDWALSYGSFYINTWNSSQLGPNYDGKLPYQYVSSTPHQVRVFIDKDGWDSNFNGDFFDDPEDLAACVELALDPGYNWYDSSNNHFELVVDLSSAEFQKRSLFNKVYPTY